MKSIVSITSILVAVAASAELAVSDVTVVSRQPWADRVKVTFNVSGVTSEANARFAFSAHDGTTKLCDIDASKVHGDVYADANGPCEVEIDTADLHPLASARRGLRDFRVGVEVSATSPVLYKVINLENDPGDANRVIYLTKEDIKAAAHPGIPGNLGTGYEENPVPGVDSFVWTGVTNVTETNWRYVQARLVFRRIPAGTFGMGASGAATTITKGFWMSVFPLTWGQYAKLMGASAGASAVPATSGSNVGSSETVTLTWNGMRGTSSVWPEKGHALEPASVCGLLCQKAGEDGFDLPTEAQWEHACRAGTTDNALYRSDKALSDCAVFGRDAMAAVGTKAPNAWGLYDMIGNVWERVLDWNGSVVGGVDPWGAASGSETRRLARGGCYRSGASNATCVSRAADDSTVPGQGGKLYGFRLVQNGRW